MRTWILTQDSPQIDSIPCRIKGFSFTNSKTIFGVQESIYSYFLKKILLSNTLWMRKLI